MEITVKVPAGPERVSVLGAAERNLKMLREALGVHITARGAKVHITGAKAPVSAAGRVLEALTAGTPRSGEPLTRQQVLDLIAEETAGDTGDEWVADPSEWDGRLNVYSGGRPVKAKTANQQKYLDAIRENDLVFAVGPAGTGKTYLAVAAAVHLLKIGMVKRLVLSRPAVEAGEKLGYLPGDMRAKVNPYLRPLFDALTDMMDPTTIRRFMETDVVEVSPLAFMRGRTLNNAAVILDEAQNTTRGQMKMFLTRLGHGSRMIVTGDVTQTDLPDPGDNGLTDAFRRLRKTPGVGFVSFDKSDVVRHQLVQRIIEAYGDDQPPARSRRGMKQPDNPEGALGDASMMVPPL